MNTPPDHDPRQRVYPPNDPRSPQYKFTPEEIRVLNECNSESFYQRSVPLGTLFGLGAYFGVKSGYFAPNVRFGAVPKVAVGVILGYFMGKLSYQQKCAEKFLALPNSRVGEILRQRRSGQIQESMEPGFGPSMSLSPFSGMSSQQTYSDLNPQNSLDIDTNRPQNDGLDDSFRPSLDFTPIHEEELPPIQQNPTTTSYDELRKKNREEYQMKRTGIYKEIPKPSYAPAPPAAGTNLDSDPRPKHKNKYGDDFE